MNTLTVEPVKRQIYPNPEHLQEAPLTCEKCGEKAPMFEANGRHNFCYTVRDGKIIRVCMSCKMAEVDRSWLWWMI